MIDWQLVILYVLGVYKAASSITLRSFLAEILKFPVIVLFGAFNILMFMKIVPSFSLEADEEKLNFLFEEIIRPIANSNKPVIAITSLLMIVYVFLKSNNIGISTGCLMSFMCVQILSAVIRIQNLVEYFYICCAVEFFIINIPFILRILNRRLMSRLYIFLILFGAVYYTYEYTDISPSIKDLITVSSELLRIYICIASLNLSHKIYSRLHEENRKLLIRKRFSKVQNNFLFYFYYGGSSLKKHSALLFLLFITPLVTYLLNLMLFDCINSYVKYLLAYYSSLPLSYLLSLHNDEHCLKNSTLNCTTLTVFIILILG